MPPRLLDKFEDINLSMNEIKNTIVTIKDEIKSFNNRVGEGSDKKVIMKRDNFGSGDDKYIWNEFSNSDGMWGVMEGNISLYFYDENNNWVGTEEGVNPDAIIKFKAESGIDMIIINKSYFKYNVPVKLIFYCEGLYSPVYAWRVKFSSNNYLTGD
jgi:hypothetical protein